jgi:calcineurin-like phosphoesterase family protein
MSNIFVAADHHLQHENILKFRDKVTGALLRPEFSSIEQHDEHIVGRHNSVVGANDTVYMLGDLAWKTNRRTRELLGSLNGKLILVPGNHDHIKWLLQTGYFHDIHMWKYMPEHTMILSHVPLNGKDVQRSGFNVHGHIHQEKMGITLNGANLVDPRYLCVSMEQIEYTPVPLDLIVTTIRPRLVTAFQEVLNATVKPGPDTVEASVQDTESPVGA